MSRDIRHRCRIDCFLAGLTHKCQGELYLSLRRKSKCLYRYLPHIVQQNTSLTSHIKLKHPVGLYRFRWWMDPICCASKVVRLAQDNLSVVHDVWIRSISCFALVERCFQDVSQDNPRVSYRHRTDRCQRAARCAFQSCRCYRSRKRHKQ